jgi:hypothetical protein
VEEGPQALLVSNNNNLDEMNLENLQNFVVDEEEIAFVLQ